jgi:hypothetical protein
MKNAFFTLPRFFTQKDADVNFFLLCEALLNPHAFKF